LSVLVGSLLRSPTIRTPILSKPGLPSLPDLLARLTHIRELQQDKVNTPKQCRFRCWPVPGTLGRQLTDSLLGS
jgi:hypothetical protein